jgi:hypothetical protein
LTLSAIVHNDGGRDAAALVSFYDGAPNHGGTLITESSDVIPGANSKTYSTPWTATAGSHTINVIVDRMNAVGESDEADNIASININVQFMVQVMMSGEVPFLPGATVYAFRGGSYLGLSAVTNEMGEAFFSIADPTGEYVFKTDYLGYCFESDPVSMPATNPGFILIQTGTVYVGAQTSYLGDTVYLENVPIYLFKPNGGYLNVEKTTSPEIRFVDFNVPFVSYQYRADYLGHQQFSDPYILDYSDWNYPQVKITFFEGLAKITVKQHGIISNGVPIYVFDASGNYLNIQKNTGDEGVPGQVQFYLPVGDYQFRADYQGNQYWVRMNGQKVIHISCDVETKLDLDTDGSEVSINVQDGANNGIDGVNVYAFTYPAMSYISKFDTTANGGIAKIQVAAGTYQFRADYLGGQFWSDPITVPDTSSVDINLHLRGVTVPVYKYQDSVQTHIGAGTPVYLFSSSENYLGQYRTTDGNGQVFFELPDGQSYKFRADLMGYQFMTPTAFTISEGVAPFVNIPYGDATIHVKTKYNGVETTRDNVPVYVFTYTDNYINQYDYTQNGGMVGFNLPVEGYKFRADYLGQQYMTDILTPTVSHTIYINEGKASITVTSGGNAVSGVPVYIFTTSHNYLSVSGTTDNNGKVDIQIPTGDYDIRADFNGNQYWSGSQTISDDATTQISITDNPSRSISDHATGSRASSRDSFTYSVIKAAGLPIKGAMVNVFSRDRSTYLGITGTTDDNGRVTFDLGDGSYSFRVDYLGLTRWDDTVQVPSTNPGMEIRHDDITIQITQTPQGPNPERLLGIPVNLFTFDGAYLRISKTTDITGRVTFNLPDSSGHFKIRYDYLGYQYMMDPFDVPSAGASIVYTISLQKVTVTVSREFKDPLGNDNILSVPAGTPVYLFTSSPLIYLNEFMPSYIDTNDNDHSKADFYLPNQPYSFRADYTSFQYWSGSTTQGPPQIQIKEAIARVHVTQGATDLDGVPVSVFNSDKNYLSLTEPTISGYHDFQLPVQNYYFRADKNGQQYMTQSSYELQWNADSGPGIITDVPIDLDGGDFQLTINDGANPIQGVTVSAFAMDGSFINLWDKTGSTGVATIHLTGGAYKFRADYMGSQWWIDNSGSGFNPPGQTTYTIPHQYMTAKVMFAGEALENVPMFLFTKDRLTYLGMTDKTSTDGTVRWFLPQSAYSIRVDYNGQHYWIDNVVLDNSGETFPTIDLAPDLEISSSDIAFTPASPMIGQSTTVTITVHNIGLGDASNVIIRIFNGDPDNGGQKIKEDQIIDRINGGGLGQKTFTWTPTTVGGTPYYVVVDQDNQIKEVNENNNKASAVVSSQDDTRTPYIYNCEIYGSDIGIFVYHSRLDLYSSKLYSLDRAIQMDSSTGTVSDSLIYDTNRDVHLEKSTMDFRNTYHTRGNIYVDETSKFTSYRTLNLEVLPHDEYNVNIGGTVYTTDKVTGTLTVDLIEYTETQWSPYYSISITSGGKTSHAHVFMIGERTVTMHIGGDSDQDGLPDDTENTLQCKFNGYELADNLMQDNTLRITNNEMVAMVNEKIGSLSAGTYYLFFKAKGNDATVQINGLAFKTYQLTDNFKNYWYEFTLNQASDITISLSGDASIGEMTITAQLIYTSPISSDTDGDGLTDYQESLTDAQFKDVGGAVTNFNAYNNDVRSLNIDYSTSFTNGQDTSFRLYYDAMSASAQVTPGTTVDLTGCVFHDIKTSSTGETVAVGDFGGNDGCLYRIGDPVATQTTFGMNAFSWLAGNHLIAIGNTVAFLMDSSGTALSSTSLPIPHAAAIVTTSGTTATIFGINGKLVFVKDYSGQLTIVSTIQIGVTGIRAVSWNGNEYVIIGSNGVYSYSTSLIPISIPDGISLSTLKDVTLSSGNNGLIVGNNGIILELKNNQLSIIADGVLGNLQRVQTVGDVSYIIGNGIYKYEKDSVEKVLGMPSGISSFSSISSDLHLIAGDGTIHKLDPKDVLTVTIGANKYTQELSPILNWYFTPEFSASDNIQITFSSATGNGALDAILLLKTKEVSQSSQYQTYSNPSQYLLNTNGIYVSDDTGIIKNKNEASIGAIKPTTRMISDDDYIYTCDNNKLYRISKDLSAYATYGISNPTGILLHDNLLFVATSPLYASDSIIAINNNYMSSMSMKWDWTTDDKIVTAPLYVNGSILVGIESTGPSYDVRSIKDGELMWSQSISSKPKELIVGTGTVIVVEENAIEILDASIYNSNPDTRILGSSIDGTFEGAISSEGLIIAYSDSAVTAYKEDDETQAWTSSRTTDIPISSYNGLIFILEDTNIQVLDLYTGVIVTTVAITASATAQPLIGDIDGDGYLEVVVMTTTDIEIVKGIAPISFKNEIPWGMRDKNIDASSSVPYSVQFVPTFPMFEDSDLDGLNDKTETDVYWNYDRLEMEDFYQRSNLKSTILFKDVYSPINPINRNLEVMHQFAVNITATWAHVNNANPLRSGYTRVQSVIPWGGHYKYIIEGTATIGFGIPTGNGDIQPTNEDSTIPASLADNKYDLTKNALVLSLRKDPPSPIIPIVPIQPVTVLMKTSLTPGVSPTSEFREIRQVKAEGIPTYNGKITGVARYFHIEQDYDVPQGIYSLELSMNMQYLGAVFDQTGTLSHNGKYMFYMKDMSIDYATVQKESYTGLKSDSDEDSLLDGVEVAKGTYVLNPDADKDGLSDPTELLYHTSPVLRDTDFDGINDRVEIGLPKVSTDPYTLYDIKAGNSPVLALSTITSPLNRDTDRDGLPDGVIDGWGLKYDGIIYSKDNWGMYGIIDWNQDWKPEFWEGEDFNGDGNWNGFIFVGGNPNPYHETSPVLTDSNGDGMDDAWQEWFALDATTLNAPPSDSDILFGRDIYFYMSPWHYLFIDGGPGQEIPTLDNLIDHNEYIIGSNPRSPDMDGDGLKDGDELSILDPAIPKVMARTNVPLGAIESTHYGAIDQWFWIQLTSNGIAVNYKYKWEVTDHAPDRTNPGVPDIWFSKNMPTNVKVLFYLQDKSWIFQSVDGTYLYIWEPNMIPNIYYGNLNYGNLYIFIKDDTLFIPDMSTEFHSDYRYQEFFTISDLFCSDSDGDSNWDGLEIDTINHLHPPATDVDHDGFSNARDWDSDNDGIKDSYEEGMTLGPNGLFYDANRGGTNPWETDTDNDGVIDKLDNYPLDKDNDGLEGYPQFMTDYGALDSYGGEEDINNDGFIDLSIGETDPNNHDTDGDGLWDGDEVGKVNLDGITNRFITNPSKSDSDMDGLNDKTESITDVNVDPNSNVPKYTDPNKFDSDHDGLLDGNDVVLHSGIADENILINKFNNANPTICVVGEDTDGVGGADKFTFKGEKSFGTDPLSFDTDKDGFSDGLECKQGTTPTDKDDKPANNALKDDSDTDGLSDDWETQHCTGDITTCLPGGDSDGDGISNLMEFLHGSYGGRLNSLDDPLDSDQDGMPDSWEYQYLPYLNPAKDDANSDADLDGLSNINEYKLQTNPKIKDTDGDGLYDGFQDLNGNGIFDKEMDGKPFEKGEDTNDNGIIDSGESNPLLKNSDYDIIPDNEESIGVRDQFTITSYWNIKPNGLNYISNSNGDIIASIATFSDSSPSISDKGNGVYLTSFTGKVAILIRYQKSDYDNNAWRYLGMYRITNSIYQIVSYPGRAEMNGIEDEYSTEFGYIWGITTLDGTFTIADMRNIDSNNNNKPDSDEVSRSRVGLVVGPIFDFVDSGSQSLSNPYNNEGWGIIESDTAGLLGSHSKGIVTSISQGEEDYKVLYKKTFPLDPGTYKILLRGNPGDGTEISYNYQTFDESFSFSVNLPQNEFNWRIIPDDIIIPKLTVTNPSPSVKITIWDQQDMGANPPLTGAILDGIIIVPVVDNYWTRMILLNQYESNIDKDNLPDLSEMNNNAHWIEAEEPEFANTGDSSATALNSETSEISNGAMLYTTKGGTIFGKYPLTGNGQSYTILIRGYSSPCSIGYPHQCFLNIGFLLSGQWTSINVELTLSPKWHQINIDVPSDNANLPITFKADSAIIWMGLDEIVIIKGTDVPHQLSDPLKIDSDYDGLDDSEEYQLHTNSLAEDTDDDGILDNSDIEPLSKDAILTFTMQEIIPLTELNIGGDNLYATITLDNTVFKDIFIPLLSSPGPWSIIISKSISISDNVNIDHDIKVHMVHQWVEEVSPNQFKIHKDTLDTSRGPENDFHVKYTTKWGMWGYGSAGWYTSSPKTDIINNGLDFTSGNGDGDNNVDLQFSFDISVGIPGMPLGYDGDGIPSLVEVKEYHTSPFLYDSDNDGLSDKTEIMYNANYFASIGLDLIMGLHPMSDITDLSTVDVFDENHLERYFDFNKDGLVDIDLNGDGILGDDNSVDLNNDGDTNDQVAVKFETVYNKDLDGNGVVEPQDWILSDWDHDNLDWWQEEHATVLIKGNPFRKDIFVEVDNMKGIEMPDRSQFFVISEFSKHEISLHIDTGWLGGNTILDFKTQVDFNQLNTYYPLDFSVNRIGIFYYCILINQRSETPPSGGYYGGQAAALPSDQFSVAINTPYRYAYDWDKSIARDFIHELGHCLGLVHDTHGEQSAMNEDIFHREYYSYNINEWNSLDFSKPHAVFRHP